MDILKPELIWIDGICFRKNAIKNSANEPFSEETEVLFTENEETVPEDESVKEFNIERVIRDCYRTSLPAPMASFSYIIGRQGATKKKIEVETKTTIIFPTRGMEGDIVVTGSSKAGVTSACTRVNVLLDCFRQRSEITHILSLPLNINNIKNAFLDFKDDVLRKCDGARGLDPSIFQNPEKLHLTIGVLALLNDREREKAAEILKECEEEILWPVLQGAPLSVSICGIEYMNDDPAAVDVLYAKVQDIGEEQRLQHLANRLLNKFVASGFMRKEHDSVTLHITLVNTKFRKDNSGETQIDRRRNQRRETFDATKILKDFSNYYFGDCTIPFISISQMYAKGEDGYYKHSAKLDLP